MPRSLKTQLLVDSLDALAFGALVVAYIRVSGKTNDAELQTALIKRECQRRGLRLLAVYCEKTTGTSLERVQFRMAIAHARRMGAALVARDESRFIRNGGPRCDRLKDPRKQDVQRFNDLVLSSGVQFATVFAPGTPYADLRGLQTREAMKLLPPEKRPGRPPGQREKKRTLVQRRQMALLRKAGLTLEEIAQRFGIVRSTVHAYLADLMKQMRLTTKPPGSEKEIVRCLYRGGFTFEEIADRLQLDLESVKRHLGIGIRSNAIARYLGILKGFAVFGKKVIKLNNKYNPFQLSPPQLE